MVNRRREAGTDEVRAAVGVGLRVARDLVIQSQEAFKIGIHLATLQGLTTQQIADELGISQAAASKYRIQGEATLRQRKASEQA